MSPGNNLGDQADQVISEFGSDVQPCASSSINLVQGWTSEIKGQSPRGGKSHATQFLRAYACSVEENYIVFFNWACVCLQNVAPRDFLRLVEIDHKNLLNERVSDVCHVESIIAVQENVWEHLMEDNKRLNKEISSNAVEYQWTGTTVTFFILFMHFCPGTITTHAESINSDLQRGLDRRIRHIQHWTQNRTS